MERQQQERARWATADPASLVAAAREKLYDGQAIKPEQREQLAPLEEIVSRFDQLARATHGSAFTTPPVSQSQ